MSRADAAGTPVAARGIIFDCDGVLLDTERLELDAELGLLAQLGLALDRGTYLAQMTGMDRAALRAALDEESRKRRGQCLPADFDRLLDEAYEAAAAAEGVRPVPGAEQAVMAAPARRAVASSCGASYLARKLHGSGLDRHFGSHVYSADLVPRGKPHPDIFLLAGGRLGLSPSQCIVIEDSVNGVRAGVAAGMEVWGFLGGSHVDETWSDRLEEAGASRILSDWRHGMTLLASLN